MIQIDERQGIIEDNNWYEIKAFSGNSKLLYLIDIIFVAFYLFIAFNQMHNEFHKISILILIQPLIIYIIIIASIFSNEPWKICIDKNNIIIYFRINKLSLVGNYFPSRKIRIDRFIVRWHSGHLLYSSRLGFNRIDFGKGEQAESFLLWLISKGVAPPTRQATRK